jgi:O-antigen/teichoic acid export membrane protein
MAQPGHAPMNGSAGRLRKLFTLKPHDTATESGRSLERYRRATLTSAAAVAGRAVGLLATLISVPLTIHYLGTERYGIWMTISSIIALFGFADLGLGNGLLNAISVSHGRDDRDFARKCVSSAFFLLAGLAGSLAIVFVVCYPWIPWHRVFNVSPELGTQEAGPAMAVFFGCFLVGMPLGIVSRIQMGYQQGFVNAAWQAVGSLLTVLCLLGVIWLRGSLPVLVLALAGAPLLATALNSVALFSRNMPWLVPTWSEMSWGAARQIGRTGLMFLVLQVAVALQSSVDNLIVAQFIGPDAVAQLAVPARLFSVAGAAVMIALIPLWPAYTEAIARGEVAWAQRTVVRSTTLAASVSLAIAVPLILLGKPIVHAWAGASIQPSQSLLLGLGCWMVLSAVGSSISMFLNAANILAFQTGCAVAVGLVGTLLKTWIAGTYGSEGIIWTTNATYAVLALVPLLLSAPLVLRRQRVIHNAVECSGWMR